MRTDFSVYFFPNAVIFLGGLTAHGSSFPKDWQEIQSVMTTLFHRCLQLQSAKEINDIIQSSLSSNHP